jgi:hypothetical protein
MEFVVRIVLSSGSSFDDEVEFRRQDRDGISWNLVESRPVTIEVGFRRQDRPVVRIVL